MLWICDDDDDNDVDDDDKPITQIKLFILPFELVSEFKEVVVVVGMEAAVSVVVSVVFAVVEI